MTGESDLRKLIVEMEPTLDPQTYVFASVPSDFVIAEKPLLRFQEDEGDTLILSETSARQAGLNDTRQFRRITLSVHSSLEAVGLTAAFAHALARHEISANVVAGYFHDHIFVPAPDADAALEALKSLSREAGAD
ncbi:MAG: ACT domain-containing protein [Alphaproteobacteria bacterium]|nr:ACT domain-containing protein [Alphaproteobacteria bacterium]